MKKSFRNTLKQMQKDPKVFPMCLGVNFFIILMCVYGPVLSMNSVYNTIVWIGVGNIPFLTLYIHGYHISLNHKWTLSIYIMRYIWGLLQVIALLYIIGKMQNASLFSAIMIFTIIYVSIEYVGKVTMHNTIKARKKQTPAILLHLPMAKRGELLSLHAQDHYVTIITTKGDALVYGKFSDLIQQTCPIDGALLHRSHWVASHAVDSFPTKQTCKLTNGMIIPISRKGLTTIKEKKWIK